MSSTDAVIDRVVEQMQTIANIGIVHARLRLAVKGQDVASLFVSDIGGQPVLRAWLVHLGRLQAEQADSGGRQDWNRSILIEGHSEFDDDGSEGELVDLAEKVNRVLWTDAQSTKLDGTILFARPPSIEANEPRYFAGVVCSYVRLAMPVHTLEAFST